MGYHYLLSGSSPGLANNYLCDLRWITGHVYDKMMQQDSQHWHD